MDPINLALLVWLIGSGLFLLLVELATGYLGVSSISERVRNLGKGAPIVVLWVVFAVGYLIAHFWDG